MGLLLKYHEYHMNYEILSYKYPYIYLLTTSQWNTLNSMQPGDICGNIIVPAHQKDYCRPSGERTNYSLIMNFHLLNITLEFPAEAYQHALYVHT